MAPITGFYYNFSYINIYNLIFTQNCSLLCSSIKKCSFIIQRKQFLNNFIRHLDRTNLHERMIWYMIY